MSLKKAAATKIRFPETGVCGLPCRLCTLYHSDGGNRCEGCKSSRRRAEGCPFHHCALERHGVEFCGNCAEREGCARWGQFRERREKMDTVVSSQTLESDLEWAERKGLSAYDKLQRERLRLLRKMLDGFNDGRSKSCYCVAATVLDLRGLKAIVVEAEKRGSGLELKERAVLLRALLEERAERKGFVLRRRK
jgi:hypothetical protein